MLAFTRSISLLFLFLLINLPSFSYAYTETLQSFQLDASTGNQFVVLGGGYTIQRGGNLQGTIQIYPAATFLELVIFNSLQLPTMAAGYDQLKYSAASYFVIQKKATLQGNS